MRASKWILLGFPVALVTAGLASHAAPRRAWKPESLVVTRSVAHPDYLDEIVGHRSKLPMLAGDPLTPAFFQRRGDDQLYDDCRKAASEPRTAIGQVARARQVVLSMERH